MTFRRCLNDYYDVENQLPSLAIDFEDLIWKVFWAECQFFYGSNHLNI